jgi:hypothetical protein
MLDFLKISITLFTKPSVPLLLLAMLAYFLILLYMLCDFTVPTVTHSVVFQLGVVKINACFGVLKYETWYKSITGTGLYCYNQ